MKWMMLGVMRVKLLIRNDFFEQIKSGKKLFEFRDAHITFVNETTKEVLRKEVRDVMIIHKSLVPEEYFSPELFEDDRILKFRLMED